MSRTAWKRSCVSPIAPTILRDGQFVLTAPISELTLDEIVAQISGKETRSLDMAGETGTVQAGEAFLELKNVSGCP